MSKNEKNLFRKIVRHFFSVLVIFLILAVIRYPYILNSDYFFTGDEGMLANAIYKLMNGGPIIFYYDFGTYFGLTFGLIAAPLICLFGPTSLAFNSPAMMFYALFIWSTYLIAKILIPRSSYLVLILMFFSSPFLTQIAIHNWPHVPTAFLGNIIILLFIKIKLSSEKTTSLVFLLFFVMGLAIYTYTYSLIFIFTISLLYLLTHPNWEQIREKISFSHLRERIKNKTTINEKICQFLDLIIFVFFFAVSFAYIFGGFGLDIGGVSVLQINQFHNAAIQLLMLIILRFLIGFTNIKLFIQKAKPDFLIQNLLIKKGTIVVAVLGFCIGLFPRIASILIGETTRGGQGYDADFLPTKLLVHFEDLLTISVPKLFGFYGFFQSLNFGWSDILDFARVVFIIPVLVIFLLSLFSFFCDNWLCLKRIITFKSMQFHPIQPIFLAPLIVCMANIIVQNGPLPRYLFPLFGFFIIWIGVFAEKIKGKLRAFPIIILVAWSGFYTISNFQYYQEQGLIKDGKLIKFKKHFIYDLVGFLESNNIVTAYSDYYVSSVGTYFSNGKINISEYMDQPIAKTQKTESLIDPDFAILATDTHLAIYKKYFEEKGIKFKTDSAVDYEIFWDFIGRQSDIDKLRSLIPG